MRSYSGDNPGNGGVDNPLCGDGLTVPQGGTKSFYCPNAVGRYVFCAPRGKRSTIILEILTTFYR